MFSSVMFGGVFPWVVSERFTVGCLEISLWDVWECFNNNHLIIIIMIIMEICIAR